MPVVFWKGVGWALGAAGVGIGSRLFLGGASDAAEGGAQLVDSSKNLLITYALVSGAFIIAKQKGWV